MAGRQVTRAAKAPRFDLGQLVVVADQYNLGVGTLGVVQKAGEGGGPDHGGLIDDEHRAGSEAPVLRVVEVCEQPVDGHRPDLRARCSSSAARAERRRRGRPTEASALFLRIGYAQRAQ
ncbi:MAG: hypothetical protein M3O70_14915 [Actinomycetota bacterium]|nr:hypothetical protein [Actinomycetota bacterium]